MKLFKISQDINDGYDTYSDAIVCAKDEEEAKHSCVCGFHKFHDGKLWFVYSDGHENEEDYCSGWATYDHVKVEYLGEAKKGLKKGLICASYHAG